MKLLRTKENVTLHYCVLFVVFCYVLYNSWSGFNEIVGVINFSVLFVYFLVGLFGKTDVLKKYGIFFSVVLFIVFFLNLGSIGVSFLDYDNLTLYLCRLLNSLFQTFFVFYICLKMIPDTNIIKEKSNKVISYILNISSIVISISVSIAFII